MDDLGRHLQTEYGVAVTRLSPLDEGVHRVHLADGTDWVARTFGPSRSSAAVRGDALVLSRLQDAGYPAERLAAPEPVSTFGERSVLVTRFVAGPRPRGGRAWAILGSMVGALHAAPAAWAPPGGAWHHLATGTPRDEIAAAVGLLEAALEDAPVAQRAPLGTLLDEVQRLDDGAGLPEALVHPDVALVNAVEDEYAAPDAPARGLVLVDWTGAGRGPRAWSLAFSLWAAGWRRPELIDVFVARYRRRITPEPEELDRLAAVMMGRPLLLLCWGVGHRDVPPAQVVAQLPELHGNCRRLAARARRAFAASA
jgi:hypothetical protein